MIIKFEPDSLKKGEHNPWGYLWVEVEAKSFPESKWSDLVLAVLSGWLLELRKMTGADVCEGDLYFMDGPFKMVIKKFGHSCEVGFYDSEIKQPFPIVEISINNLVDSVIAVAEEAIQVCKDKRIPSEDIERVEKLILELKQ